MTLSIKGSGPWIYIENDVVQCLSGEEHLCKSVFGFVFGICQTSLKTGCQG